MYKEGIRAGRIGGLHRKANLLLVVITALLGLYIALIPVLPRVALAYKQKTDATKGFKYKSDAARAAGVDDSTLQDAPRQNRLVIPKLSVDTPILEGPNIERLGLGIWRRSHTSTPDKRSNTVIAGHRFWNSGPAQFFNLDKLHVNDVIIVFWEGKEYDYTVGGSSVVTPDRIDIEAPTDNPRLTLYTCTPVWTAKNRLVVTADLKQLTGEAGQRL